MTPDELADAIGKDSHALVETRSGKRYRIHEDQIPMARQGGLVYGTPMARSFRRKGSVVWFDLANVKLVKD